MCGWCRGCWWGGTGGRREGMHKILSKANVCFLMCVPLYLLHPQEQFAAHPLPAQSSGGTLSTSDLVCLPSATCRDKSLHIHFLRSPVEVVGASGEEGRVTGVKLERTQLEAGATPGGDQKARGTGELAAAFCWVCAGRLHRLAGS